MSEIHEVLSRMWADLLARPSGPFALRFLLQPLMAVIFAMRDGIKDAQAGRLPYFWAVLRDAAQRRARLGEGLRATGKIIAFGIAIDAVYQFKTLDTFYPVEALAIALLLGFAPYLLMRGPVERVARRWVEAKRPEQDTVKPESRGRVT